MPILCPARRLAALCLAALCLAALLGLAACAPLPGSTTLLVDGQRIEQLKAGHGSPVVVFENGLNGQMNVWAKVQPAIAAQTTTFAYNRPGIGASTPPTTGPTTPRDGEAQVNELRRLLRARGLAPPYVLVGHSYGALTQQLYARLYPAEVAGLVLVDSTHPEQFSGAGAPENWPLAVRLAVHAVMRPAARAELAALPATGARLLALPPPTGMPVIVLTATRPPPGASALSRDSYAKRKDIARLNPGAQQIWVDSGHMIPLDAPQAVIDAILAILATQT